MAHSPLSLLLLTHTYSHLTLQQSLQRYLYVGVASTCIYISAAHFLANIALIAQSLNHALCTLISNKVHLVMCPSVKLHHYHMSVL